jgi:hypothetical protein
MSDHPSRRGPVASALLARRARLALVGAVVVAVGAGCSPLPRSLSPELARAAAERSVPLVEKGPDAAFLEPGERTRCVVRPFGVEPADATTIDRVTVVYAGVTCVVVAPGVPYDEAGQSQLPVVVHLDTGVVEQPGDGEQYSQDIHRMFPKALWDRAYDPVPNAEDDAVDAELRRRFAEAQATPR